jgi:hypothetical protein
MIVAIKPLSHNRRSLRVFFLKYCIAFSSSAVLPLYLLSHLKEYQTRIHHTIIGERRIIVLNNVSILNQYDFSTVKDVPPMAVPLLTRVNQLVL